MDLVIDSNILFAALIKNSLTLELLFREDLHFYAPQFIFGEFAKYEEEIKRKTEKTDDAFEWVLKIFQRRIITFPQEEILPFIEKARAFSPDINDLPYLALALKLNIPLWSNDRLLKEKQNKVKVYSTSDLLKILKS